jgi:Fur family ferric uptake transcriptional regulator
MTQAPQADPREFSGLDEVLRLLRDHGHRVTATCRAVLQTLFGAAGPVSAQFILERGSSAGGAPLEIASVYRNLERLETLGVVQHVHLGHGPGLYILVGSGEHEFLTCERCHRVVTVAPADLDPVREQIRETFGYEARFGHFPIVGLCPSCARVTR